MAKLNSKKRKNCAFMKKKSLVGTTPDYFFSEKKREKIHFFPDLCNV